MAVRMRIAQINGVLGDGPGQVQRIGAAAAQAQADGVQCLLLPALAPLGGPGAGDFVQRSALLAAQEQMLAQVLAASRAWPDVALVLSHPARHGTGVAHAVQVVRAGAVLATGHQQTVNGEDLLWRNACPGPMQPCVFDAGGVRIGVLPGSQEAPWDALAAGAQALVCLPAVPFFAGQQAAQEAALAALAERAGVPCIGVHPVGGQDAWVFAGASIAVDAQGRLAVRAPAFAVAQADFVCHADGWITADAALAPALDDRASLWHALVLAVRDYVEKNRFPGALLGLSGGIDSALVLAIAVDALGPQRVRTVMMPSPYTADISWQDAQTMADGLGVRHDVIHIAPQVQAFEQALAPLLAGTAPDTTEENLQARCRGTLLMALSNKFGPVVLTTSNKSEVAMGYGTLYGDMAGGFAVLCDVWKTQVFALARWRNAHDPFGTGAAPIPERIITRPPSAELRPDQKDEDSLPPYDVLDALLRQYLEQGASPAQLAQVGFAPELVERVLRLLRLSEYKRRQAPGGPRLSQTAFGHDWQVPMTHRFAV
ncbi:MAG: NAD+ synthase [Comamonas sp.]|nr:NAD+ synthase [Comamonas sp.]